MKNVEVTVTALVDLVRFLEAGGCTDAPTLAEHYGVSRRTAQRWIERVERWVPVERSRSGYRQTVRKLVIK